MNAYETDNYSRLTILSPPYNMITPSIEKKRIETNTIASFYEMHGFYCEATVCLSLSALVFIAPQLIKPSLFASLEIFL
jgi:hypothetical protein